ncbi:ImmA/IrrE family metallo-endopeptidase [Kingella oralis]|jgi:hypothetical protein|uniref:ImmA/IrrE family metallo-endopeptidase n=1 Tax=Kingella oralis TaxID=505 RepID=UPI003C6FCC9A
MNIDTLARNILNTYWDLSIPIDVHQIAKNMEVEVQEVSHIGTSVDNISGSFEIINNRPVCTIRTSDAFVRQRFTLAHELGHYVLNHGKAFRDNDAVFSGRYNYDYREVEANTFAAALLMPADAVHEAIVNIPHLTIGQLADIFNVSHTAMGYRLTNLGYNL